jgi:hypothetical protein
MWREAKGGFIGRGMGRKNLKASAFHVEKKKLKKIRC